MSKNVVHVYVSNVKYICTTSCNAEIKGFSLVSNCGDRDWWIK